MIKAVKGFKDILPDETPYWQFLEEKARKLLKSFGFREIRIPVLEKLELFDRGIGSTTDIVEKEMYTFKDKGGNLVAMRPEATASIARAYIENALHLKDPLGKYYFIGPMFRYERPQAGRLRQFNQINVEVFGTKSSSLDAEVMALLHNIADEVGISDGVTLEVNHIGCKKCRPIYRQILINYLNQNREALCEDCRKRLERNPLRALDCKRQNCRRVALSAPKLTDHLCDECRSYFEEVIEYLQIYQVPHVINPLIVRGLDYYTGVVFELTTTELGAQSAVAAGGRYDYLVEELGGPSVPGIGFAIGEERAVAMLKNRKKLTPPAPLFFFAVLGDAAKKKCIPIVLELRKRGVYTEMEHENRSLKSQMRKANRLKARYAVMVGEDELEKGRAVVRDMEKKEQFDIELSSEAFLKLAEEEVR
ncbi:MAG: histidine--tRNA ligase [Deferribacteres bacterium]|nr:histidine--tRNA ligase [Deferribacteres bacterium]